MSSLNNERQPIFRIPSEELPSVEVGVTEHSINTEDVNPFTTKPIETEWETNELIMNDPHMRVTARVSMQDIGQTESSKYISAQHLQMGWNWCGGDSHCYMKSNQHSY